MENPHVSSIIEKWAMERLQSAPKAELGLLDGVMMVRGVVVWGVLRAQRVIGCDIMGWGTGMWGVMVGGVMVVQGMVMARGVRMVQSMMTAQGNQIHSFHCCHRQSTMGFVSPSSPQEGAEHMAGLSQAVC